MYLKRRRSTRLSSIAIAAAIVLSGRYALPAQTLDYSSLFDTGSDDDSDSSLDLGSLLNQQLLQQLLKASPSPSAAVVVPSASPVPTPTYYHVCPLCGTSFPGTAPYKGVAWGYRLDLRMYGQVKDPPAAPLCPKCRFVIYKTTYEETELSRLRPYVASSEYVSIDQRNTSYFYLARLREKGMVKMKNGDYDIAYAYLQAAWQAEDLGDQELESRYLERALSHVERYAASAKRGGEYFQTVKILVAELKRRLGRFTEAENALRAIEKDEAFSAKYLQDIISSELAYIRVEDSDPH